MRSIVYFIAAGVCNAGFHSLASHTQALKTATSCRQQCVKMEVMKVERSTANEAASALGWEIRPIAEALGAEVSTATTQRAATVADCTMSMHND